MGYPEEKNVDADVRSVARAAERTGQRDAERAPRLVGLHVSARDELTAIPTTLNESGLAR